MLSKQPYTLNPKPKEQKQISCFRGGHWGSGLWGVRPFEGTPEAERSSLNPEAYHGGLHSYLGFYYICFLLGGGVVFMIDIPRNLF